MACQLVTTGWYASAQPRSYTTFGDDSIRGPEFRRLWWQSLQSFVRPQHVYVVDSASPVKPSDDTFAKPPTDLRVVELLINPGHSQNTVHHYCGFMAGMLLGMEYALYSGVDYFLYVEQDALLYGQNLIAVVEKALLRNGVVFGGNSGGLVQQSLVAFDRRIMRRFLSNMHAIDLSDKLLSPEFKFMYAASLVRHLPILSLLSYDRSRWIRHPLMQLAIKLSGALRQYEIMPFGYGRLRPINFDDPVFYFQHGSAEEIATYKQRTGFI